MEKIKVVFLDGHLVDSKSGQTINFIQGEEYEIISENNAFKFEDELLKIDEPLSSNDKEEWIKNKYDKYLLLLEAGENLIFRISNQKRQHQQTYYAFFSCRLMEDLYIFHQPSNYKESHMDWKLANCKVELRKAVNVYLSEKIYAESLNSLFTRTAQAYSKFNNSGTTNVFKNFCRYYGKFENAISKYSDRDYSLETIEKLRINILKIK